MGFIGRKLEVGIGKESSRGTAVTPTYWLMKTKASVEDQVDYVDNDESFGNISDSADSQISKNMGGGNIEGIVKDKSVGLLLLGALGSVASVQRGGDVTVYDHTFSLLNSNQHPCLTVECKNDLEQKAYALAMIESLKLTAELGKYAEFSAAFKSKKGATAVNSPAYAALENNFVAKMISVKIASTQAGLTGASAIKVKKIELDITKNLVEDMQIGNVEPVDIYNQEFTVEGTIEAIYDATTFKALYTAGTKNALRIDLNNSDVTIGSTGHPELVIDLYRCAFKDWKRSDDNKGIVTQTIKFKGEYSITDAKFMTAVLTNLATSY